MKAAFDIQILLKNEITGVGINEDGLIRSLISLHPETQFVLEYFSFSNVQAKQEKARKYLNNNVELRECRFFPAAAYRFLSALLPLPRCFFFRDGADITHFFDFIIPPFVRGKKVVTIHDMVIRRFPETVRAKTKFVLKLCLRQSVRRADRIITVSEFSKREILHYYPYLENKIKVVYSGVDLDRYNPAIDPEETRRVRSVYRINGEYILYLGMLEPRKNIERLVEAYSRVKNRRTDFPVLVLAGKKGWLYESIFQRVTELGLENRVLFTGYVPDADKPGLLAGAKCFCFPSIYEGFGTPPLEAMACGIPILTSNAASLPEINGEAAFYVDPYSVESIAEGMERLCFDMTLRENLRSKGLERVKQFSWGKKADSLYAVYEDLMHEGEKASQ